MKIAMAQMSMTDNVSQNLDKCMGFCDNAKNCDLLFFPEIQSARIAALSPGASPPEVKIPTVLIVEAFMPLIITFFARNGQQKNERKSLLKILKSFFNIPIMEV